MFWPDEKVFAKQTWWSWPAHAAGPTYGGVVEALRPAIRAALLLGYQVEAIDIALGAGPPGQVSRWESIELDTLQLSASGRQLDIQRPFEGLNIRLKVAEITDLVGAVTGTYALDVDLPLFGSDEAIPDDSEEFVGPVLVPDDLVAGVRSFVTDAVATLVARLPAAPAQDQSQQEEWLVPREAGGGLAWIFDPTHWHGLTGAAKVKLWPIALELLSHPEGFLAGQLFGDRREHPSTPDLGEQLPDLGGGAASLPFLVRRRNPHHYEDLSFWKHLLLSLQGRGESHRLPEWVRDPIAGDLYHGPTWLEAICELLRRGVVRIDGLVEAPDPPEPIVAVAAPVTAGQPVREFTLRVWGGDAEIVCRRVTVFDDESHEGLEDSVAWDYLPGDAQTTPAVIVVAGRGVAVDPPRPAPDRGIDRPWQDADRWMLEIYRVQDDALVPRGGQMIDTARLLAPVVPGTPSGQVSTITFPPLVVKPKPNGAFVQFPAWPIPSNVTGDPVGEMSVVEITVDPTSGTAAYTVDAHFYWRSFGEVRDVGGVHLCLWATEGVRIEGNHTSFAAGPPQRGNPSTLQNEEWSAWTFYAELWEASPPRALPRPWGTMLPISRTTPQGLTWEREPPRLDYDSQAQQASHGGLTLIPALHSYGPPGYAGSLALDLVDILLSFIPFVGDVVDIGECLWVLATGRDRWGRAVSDFEQVLMVVGACVPLVSSTFVRRAGTLLLDAAPATSPTDLARLFTRAARDSILDDEGAEAALGFAELFSSTRLPASIANREAAADFIRSLNVDPAAVTAVAERLARDRAVGWPSVTDFLTADGDSFTLGPLQAAYSRYLRDNPPISPVRWVEDHVLAGAP